METPTKKTSEFKKSFSSLDILMIAFGAMIGWGWVVSTGDWIGTAGVIGAMLGFILGGVMIFFIGMTYAELTPAMPECGGEHVFSMRAMGPIGSFVCTWAIVLGYVSVVCFEACALPTIITYVWPDFLQGYLYSVAGFDIYATWLGTAVLFAVFITVINIMGAQIAAKLQNILTLCIGAAGILLIAASVITGDASNLQDQMFEGSGMGGMMATIVKVAAVSPFFFIGFDVIPQAAEEINVPLKKIGKILILSIVLGISFYALVIFSVGYVMTGDQIAASANGTGLVTADAMAAAFHSNIMAKVLILAGMCGILTSWNSFMIGGSRAMYSMAESYMIPRILHGIAVLHHPACEGTGHGSPVSGEALEAHRHHGRADVRHHDHAVHPSGHRCDPGSAGMAHGRRLVRARRRVLHLQQDGLQGQVRLLCAAVRQRTR